MIVGWGGSAVTVLGFTADGEGFRGLLLLLLLLLLLSADVCIVDVATADICCICSFRLEPLDLWRMRAGDVLGVTLSAVGVAVAVARGAGSSIFGSSIFGSSIFGTSIAIAIAIAD